MKTNRQKIDRPGFAVVQMRGTERSAFLAEMRSPEAEERERRVVRPRLAWQDRRLPGEPITGAWR